MKSLKSTKGFTLVELIVVIAILGILAAVAVPAYSGYITKAEEAGDTQVISAVNTAIQAATAVNDADLDSSTSNTKYDTTNKKIVVAFTGEDATQATTDYTLYIGSNSTELSYYTSIKVEDGLIKGVR